MDDGFELLEQKVHKAAARLRELAGERDALRAEAASLRAETESLKARLHKAEEEARSGDSRAQPELRARAEKAERELAALQHDREELRGRVAKLIELLESLG